MCRSLFRGAPYRASHRRSWLALALALVIGVGAVLLVGGRVYAQAEPATEDGTCESCHHAQAESWQGSSHAQRDAGATPVAPCESCHGEYRGGHPESDAMTLDVDSSICNECHDETAAQWQGTMHAQANVQCIGCHKAHSQTLRLTDDELCVTCHKEPVQDEFHSAHWDGAVSCVECHMAAPGAPAGSDPALAALAAPIHDFVHVSAQQCLDCHKEEVVSSAPRPAAAQLAVASPKLAESTTLSAASLDTVTQHNQFLLLLGPVLLGVGVGGGGILGIVFMLVAGRLESRRRDATAASRQDAEEDL